MPYDNNKVLKYNHGEESMRVPFIYADLENRCIFTRMRSCQNDLEKFYIEKKTKHTPSDYSLFTNCSFDAAKNKLVIEAKIVWKSFVKTSDSMQ